MQRQNGSHRHYRHPDGRRVTLSFHHSGDTFRPGTIRSVIEIQARWTVQDLLRLGLASSSIFLPLALGKVLSPRLPVKFNPALRHAIVVVFRHADVVELDLRAAAR
jgi:HicA toxin of bacterial toxin-antitoxin,